MKKVFYSLISLLFTLAIVLAILGTHFYIFTQSPLTVKPEGYVILIPNGTPVQKIATQLKKDKILEYPYWFMLSVLLQGDWHKLKAGEYLIKSGSTPFDLIEQVREGKVIQYAFTIIPGWSFDRLMQEIKLAPKLTQTLSGLTPNEVMAKLGHPAEHPEGRFFAETYYYPNGTTDIQFLQRSYHVLQDKLIQLWNKRAVDVLPFSTPYEALILASIVEKESDLAEEYAEIAGVYVRRLKINMPLQADPTVIYGAGKEYGGTIDSKMLKIPTPYNTYQVTGLPPTPIAFPSTKALEAALNPKPGDTLYFVAKPEGKGHIFSKTLQEHQLAVSRYRNRDGVLRKRK